MNPFLLRYILLGHIASSAQVDRYAYKLAALINRRLKTSVRFKALYPILKMFEEKGWTTGQQAKAPVASGGCREHKITEKGLDELRRLEDLLRGESDLFQKTMEFVKKQSKANDDAKRNT